MTIGASLEARAKSTIVNTLLTKRQTQNNTRLHIIQLLDLFTITFNLDVYIKSIKQSNDN